MRNTSSNESTHRDTFNPLDSVEVVLDYHNWVYERPNEEELVVDVAGAACNYRILFLWQKEMQSLQLNCRYDFVIHDDNMHDAAQTLLNINQELWLGHFTLLGESKNPCFRHTSLLRDHSAEDEQNIVEDMVDIALTHCERFYAAFNLLAQDKKPHDVMMDLAIMETIGQS